MGNDQSNPRNEAALLLQLSNYDDTIRRLRNRLSAVEDEEQWMNKRVESDRVKSIKAAEELKDCMAECQKMESKHDRLVRRKATYDVEAARLANDIKQNLLPSSVDDAYLRPLMCRKMEEECEETDESITVANVTEREFLRNMAMHGWSNCEAPKSTVRIQKFVGFEFMY